VLGVVKAQMCIRKLEWLKDELLTHPHSRFESTRVESGSADIGGAYRPSLAKWSETDKIHFWCS